MVLRKDGGIDVQGIAVNFMFRTSWRISYDFANTLDLRKFVHHGVRHEQAEELATPSALGAWMRERGLGEHGPPPSQKQFENALRLRNRSATISGAILPRAPRKQGVIDTLNKAMEPFSLRVAGLGKAG